MRRGSLRAAEEITGHKYETISVWLHRAAAHGEAFTAVLVQHLHLTTVEIDEFWSFVRKKTGNRMKPTQANAGGVWYRIAPAASSWQQRLDASVSR